jgi:hypothetical protein
MTSTRVVVVASLFAIGIAAYPLSKKLLQTVPEPPPALSQVPDTTYPSAQIDTATKRAWISFGQASQEIEIQRAEMPQSPPGPWSFQLQTLSHSFTATDVRTSCNTTSNEIQDVFIAGTYSTGQSTLEKWHFTYPAQSVAYTPLAQRPLPTVRRTVVFLGTSLGHIASLAVDREGRFVILLTLESHAIYKIGVTLNSVPQLLFDSTTVPDLASALSVICTHHITEGRQYHIVPEYMHGSPVDGTTLIMRDPENDGTFVAPVSYTEVQMENLGYNLVESFVPYCGRWY